jgi:prostaglandin reductase 1
MKAQKWILAKKFNGDPTSENIKLVEFDLPDELQPGEVLLQAVYLTVDPYMRVFSETVGDPIIGEQLCEVIKSKNDSFPVGSSLLAKVGWQSHFISKGENLEKIRFDIGNTPKSYTLGVLGMPGATAHLVFEKAEPKANETIVITAASGAVGGIIGQLAKIRGLKVIGFVGSDEKLNYCKNELGFDHVFNYKKTDFSKALTEVAPDGIDIFMDSVGGDFYHKIVNDHMKLYGRVMVLGSIANYNDKDKALVPQTNMTIFVKQLSVNGFLCFRYYDDWPKSFVVINELIKEGKLKVKENVFEGFESMRDAFIGLFKGENFGKAIIKCKK